ncbi:MAG: decaprenyl-phosphate phosphoribosyltransferase [Vampirovibrionia bacterium]
MIKEYFKLLRPHQYLKNLFIFTPIIFGLQINNFSLLEKALLAFIAFSLVASSIYIFNDIKDIKEDEKHPTKKLRPIASGKITKNSALKSMGILFIAGMALGFFLNITFLYILLGYFVMNILYSLWLKHISILDISIIATGFVLRVFAGSVVVDIFASEWIIIMTFLLALFLALAKRRDDVLLTTTGESTRKNIDGYNLEFINASMLIMASIVIVAYIMYTLSPITTVKFNTNDLYLTTFFVITGLLRYMQITFVENNSGSPTNILLKDRFLQLIILLWLASFIIIIY